MNGQWLDLKQILIEKQKKFRQEKTILEKYKQKIEKIEEILKKIN